MAPPTSELLIQVISKIPLFKGVSPTQVRQILSMCEHRTVEEDDKLCETGNPCDEMYILVAGELALVAADGTHIGEIVPVATIGDIDLLTGKASTKTLAVTKASHIFAISRFKFERVLRRDIDLQIKLYKNVAHILADQTSGGQEREGEERQVEKVRYEARISLLERQLKLQAQKMEVAMEMLADRAEISQQEAEYHMRERLQDLIPRILIVDDEPEFRRFAKDALNSFNVVEATSGQQALKIVQEERLDLIIADIRMPEMDGCTLLTNLRTKFPGLPVLAVSGFLEADDIENYGFDGFIDKPMGSDKLQEVVEVALAKDKVKSE